MIFVSGDSSEKPKQRQQRTFLLQKKPINKYVHEEWQIAVLVQFDTGMIACMFVCWVYVWIFLAAEPKDVSSEQFVCFYVCY